MKIKAIASAFALTLLAGCSTLPHTGPEVSDIHKFEKNPSIPVIKMTYQMARDLNDAEKARTQAAIDEAIRKLGQGQIARDHVLEAGDRIDASLLTFSSSPNGSSEPNTNTMSWHFEVDHAGMINLPYIGMTKIAGLTLAKAQDVIAARYNASGMFQSPAVQINYTENETNGVIVTGNVASPKIIPWNAGGFTLSKAITLALGNGAQVLGQDQNSSLNNDKSAVTATVTRRGVGPVSLPISVALERDIPVMETDKIIINKKPSVRVTVMGGGIKKNGMYGFGDHPSLAQVIATAQGLDADTADSKAVFVFRQNPAKLYDFSWNKVDAILASQEFPVEDNDIVYVAESAIVPIERVLSVVMQFAMLGAIAR